MATFNSNYGRRDSYIQLTVNPRAYNISTNSTVVDWSLRVYTGVTYWQGNVQTSNVYVNGGSSLWSASTSNTYAVRTWYNLGSGSKTIPHNSDGTKTISISAAFAVEAGGAGIGSVSISTSMALPTIPRASSIGTISGNQIGSEITVNISRASSSFTHYVYYHLPGQSWQNVSTTATTSSSFTIPVTSSSFLPNSSSGVLNILIYTYSGSTRIGGDTTKTHTVYVPSSVVPSFSSLSASEGNASVTSAIGNAYVQHKSSAKLTINGASGIHGSTIKSYSITGHGINTSGSSGTTSTITSSGNITYTATVTDSRGRPASRTATINVLAYTGPRLSGLSYYRSNSSGVHDPLGASITIKGTVTSSSLKVGGVEKNIVNYQSQTALGSAWTDRTTQSYAKTSHAYSATFAGFGVDDSYNVRSRAGDAFGWGSWSAGRIPTGEVTQQWSRKTTSFGKMIDDPSYNIQAGSGGIHSEGPASLASYLILRGSSSGIQNATYVQFMENDGSTRQGYIGFGSGVNGYLHVNNDFGSRIAMNKDLYINDNLAWHRGNSNVIETDGSNPNGSYIRFSNGMQICYNMNIVSSNNTTIGTTVTLPANFYDTSYSLIASARGMVSGGTAASYVTESVSVTSTHCRIKIMAHGPTNITGTGNPEFGYVAIGRWK